MSRSRLFSALCGYAFLVNFSRVVMAPLVSVFIATFGVGEATAGLAASAAWIGSALPRIPTGYLLTKVSRLTVVLVAGVVLAVGAASAAVAGTVTLVVLGAGLAGVASGLYFVTGNTLVSELFPARVGRMIGIHGTANQVAAAVAAPVVTLAVGATVDWTPVLVALNLPADQPWRLVFVALSIAGLATTVVTFVVSRGVDLPDAGAEDRDFVGAATAEWRTILFGIAVMGMLGFAWQGVFNFYQLFMESRGVAPGIARNALTLVFVAGIPAFAVSGWLADRLPRAPYLLGLAATFVVLVFALTFASGTAALLAVSVALGYTVHSIYPAIDTFLLGSFPDDNRASAYAVYSGVMMLAQAPGSWFVGALAEAGVPYVTTFRGLAAAVGVVIAALFVFQRAGRLPS
ncbi:D-galactonate transporter [Halolamina pelagica]|uniref:D-galactonate transporter n=1 Tax=Halolamina pelagica TaxID=699431 RepID=A0A0P7GM77_9EURY|nr:MFS transporter [Halolamina pelagica]KPN29652.1 D-galactonate transporter [Halolamina pelagica]